MIWLAMQLAHVICSSILKCATIFLYIQVAVDLIGPLPVTAGGNQFIVTMIDYFTKWPEAAALPSKSADGIAQFIYQTMCRYNRYYNMSSR